MLRSMLRRALLAAALVFLPQAAAAEAPVPALNARVTDLTGTLTPDQRAGLEAKLAAFEARKGSQVAVLMVPTTQPEAIEQYSMRVVEQWKLGRKKVDDGVLLIVARNDRKMRIEVGYGLEGAVPDAVAKRIVSDIIAPRFKEGDFYGGITAGVDRILRAIEGEPLPPPSARAARSEDAGWFELLMPAVVFAFIAGTFLKAIFGRYVGSGMVGAGIGAVAYLLSGIAAALAIGIISFLISLLSGAVRGGGRGHGGHWGSGGSWGGGWSSGGGGGFGGGGGGFGGGGASGSW